jgi:hypothetical protein
MKTADLVKKKKQRVVVRVPTKLREKLGEEIKGTVLGLIKTGKNVTMVKVKVARRGIFQFRPQDLDVA